MKPYLIQDLNDPTKMKVEFRSRQPKDSYVCPMVDGKWITDPNILEIVDGDVIVSHIKREIQDNLRHIKQQEDNSVIYKRQRLVEYPSELDIIEALMEAQEGRPEKLEEIKAKRLEVKTKYPKPE